MECATSSKAASARPAGDRVRFTAQLADAATGHHVWAERYDRELDDVFALQDEIVARIVAELVQNISEEGTRSTCRMPHRFWLEQAEAELKELQHGS